MSRRQVAGLVTSLASVLFLVLTLLVALGSVQEVDDAARQVFRPDDMWSTPQLYAGEVIDGLKPLHVVLTATLVVGWLSVRRRTVRPLVLMGGAVCATVTTTWVTKQALGRPDTTGVEGGGSYSSGHVAILLVVGGCLVLLAGRARWWMWVLTGAVACLMAVSLMVQATHWLSDLVGGALLGAAVLGGVALVTDREGGAHRDSRDPSSCS